MKSEEVYTPSPTKQKSQKLGTDWDFISSPIRTLDYEEDNLPVPRRLKSQLQTVNVEMTDCNQKYGLAPYGEEQNIDMGNQSTQASSIDSASTLSRESSITSANCKPKISAKYVAPKKQPNRRKFKEMLKNIDRKEFSGSAFMGKLNDAAGDSDSFSMLPDQEDDMSLDDHIDALAKQYSTEVHTPEDNDFGISNLNFGVPNDKTHNQVANKAAIGLRARKVLNEPYCDQVRISIGCSRIESIPDLMELTKRTNLNELSSSFFQKLNKVFTQKSAEVPNAMVKINNEPIFPVKTTMDYLCSIYKGSQARIKKIQVEDNELQRILISVHPVTFQ